MYDLEVHVYNNIDKSGAGDYVYVIRSKNSGMEQAATQVVSKPLDAELAQQLRDELAEKRNPTQNKDNDDEEVVGGEDTEAQDETKE